MCVARLASIQFERSDPRFQTQHGRLLYSQIGDKGAVVTAVIGLLNGVSLPSGVELMRGCHPALISIYFEMTTSHRNITMENGFISNWQ